MAINAPTKQHSRNARLSFYTSNSTSQSRGANASTWDRVCRRYGISTKERVDQKRVEKSLAVRSPLLPRHRVKGRMRVLYVRGTEYIVFILCSRAKFSSTTVERSDTTHNETRRKVNKSAIRTFSYVPYYIEREGEKRGSTTPHQLKRLIISRIL